MAIHSGVKMGQNCLPGVERVKFVVKNGVKAVVMWPSDKNRVISLLLLWLCQALDLLELLELFHSVCRAQYKV